VSDRPFPALCPQCNEWHALTVSCAAHRGVVRQSEYTQNRVDAEEKAAVERHNRGRPKKQQP
jgi:hypothetical protein